MDKINPQHPTPLEFIKAVMAREPDFVIGGIPIFVHPLLSGDCFIVVDSSYVLIAKNGWWRTLPREEFQRQIMKVINS